MSHTVKLNVYDLS